MVEPVPNPNGTGPGDENGPVNALTSIHGRIHCPDTNEAHDDENELDRIDTDNFLETLAEVALSVARRGSSSERDEDRIDA